MDLYTKSVLTIIAICLAILSLKPDAPAVLAQEPEPALFVEPDTTTILKPDGSAQLKGKVVINLRTGEVWGFPTLVNLPYPVDSTGKQPPVSEPIYLGRFNFSAMVRKP